MKKKIMPRKNVGDSDQRKRGLAREGSKVRTSGRDVGPGKEGRKKIKRMFKLGL